MKTKSNRVHALVGTALLALSAISASHAADNVIKENAAEHVAPFVNQKVDFVHVINTHDKVTVTIHYKGQEAFTDVLDPKSAYAGIPQSSAFNTVMNSMWPFINENVKDWKYVQTSDAAHPVVVTATYFNGEIERREFQLSDLAD